MEEIKTNTKKNDFLDQFDRIDFSFDQTFKSFRKQAADRIETLEFPTRKTEYWKYTRVNNLLNVAYNPGPDESFMNVDDFRFDGVDELVFVNGYFRPDLSKFEGNSSIVVRPLSELKEEQHPVVVEHLGSLTRKRDEIFAAINDAYHNDGVGIIVERNAVIERPVHVINVVTGKNALSQPRNFIYTSENSEFSLIESYVSGHNAENCFTNSVSEIILNKNARMSHFKVQQQNNHNNHIATEETDLAENSNYSIYTITISGKLVRNNLNVLLREKHSECNLKGIYLTKDRQHVDNHTLIDHFASNCESNELYKGVLNERSTTVFNGKVFVHRPAQKTNAFQSNANILLTDTATANSKPELEIYADDVKCSHGSTTGQLDEDALFYLQARGIDKELARDLLLHAFASEVLEQISFEPLKERIHEHIINRYNRVS